METEIRIVDSTLENAAQFAMCGYKNIKNEGYRLKVEWLKERFKEGMRHKVLYSEMDGAVGAIEYIPGEYAWRPVQAKGYLFIHCIYIIPKKYKAAGYGKMLLESCIEDAKQNDLKGVAVITRAGTLMASKDLFLKYNFEVVDSAPPDFELLVLKLKAEAENPKISSFVKSNEFSEYQHLTIMTSNQCPYADKAAGEISIAAKEIYQMTPEIKMLNSADQAQKSPSPFGTFCVLYQGKIIADHPISKRRFCNIMDKLLT